MKTEIEKRASKFIDETDMMQFSTMEIMVMFAEKELKAMNYNQCCKSDSEQLADKEKQKNMIIEMMKKDEEDGLYDNNKS